MFVGNLDFKATEDDLKEVFQPFGKFEVNVHKTKSGKPLGYAHVNFENPEQAKSAFKALSTKDIEIKDRKLRIDVAKPKRI